MAEPTPSELLVLNCIIYADGNGPKAKDSIYQWASELNNDPKRLDAVADSHPAEISSKEFRKLIATILANKDVYGQMTVVDVSESPGNPKSASPEDGPQIINATIDYGGKPIILFKGTTGDLEWRDNGMGGYAGVTDTVQQMAALAYFRQQMSLYPGQTAIVTGHSKGGNKAQYVGVLAGDQVDQVYSFDGQGFNQPFMLKYADLIKQNSWKITNISNQNDYVNILFNALTGSHQLYLNSPAANGGWWIGNWVKRWHSPVTMFNLKDSTFSLDLSQASDTPSKLMGELDGFITFAQGHMSEHDFAYLCYFLVSKFMTDPGDYGVPQDMPDGFKLRLLSLVKNYLENEGIDPQDVIWKTPGIFSMLTVIPVLGPVIGSSKVSLAIILAAIPSTGYASVPRDYSDEVKQRLMALADEVAAEPWWDFRKWDIWYRIDRYVFGGVDFAKDETERQTYYRKMIDINGTSRAEIERIFADVKTAEGTFASDNQNRTSHAEAILSKLRAIAGRIPA